MLKSPFRKVFLLIVLIHFAYATYAQENQQIIDEFDVFNEYTRLGISVQPILYKGAEFSKSNITNFKTTAYIPGIQFAIRYHFNPAKAFSINTGLILTWTPYAKYSFILNEEDIYNPSVSSYKRKIIDDKNLLIPINFEYKLRVGRDLYLNFNGGINTSMQGGGGGSNIFDIKNDKGANIEAYKVEYSRAYFYFSTTLSSGLYFTLNRYMLRVNLLYNKSLNDFEKGNYYFTNLRSSPNEKGTYNFSGDYFGLSTTIYFKRKI